MARIIALNGFRFDPAKAELKDVVAPPYDIISAEQRDFLFERHPNNIVHLTNPIDAPDDAPLKNKYTRAGKALEEWIKAGILKRDPRPSVYIYEQRYQYSDGAPQVRRGFMALARLEERESGVILGHERTLMPAIYDRLNLLKECKANLSPIFSLYSQPEGAIDSILEEIATSPPDCDFVDDGGICNRLWVVADPAIISRLTSEMTDKALIIADGHHRYETALIYRHIRRNEKADCEDALYNYTLMMFVNLDTGVTIYPVHRIIFNIPDFDPAEFRRKLSEYFDIVPVAFGCSDCEEAAKRLLGQMAEEGKKRHTFGLYLGGARLELLVSKDDSILRDLAPKEHCKSFRELDVAIAQAVIFQRMLGMSAGAISKEEHVRYTPSEQKALEAVRRGEAQAALLLNPTKPEQVKAVTYEGEKMPQKSTYFYPKLLSGLVISRFDP